MILVTGATGKIGSELAKNLARRHWPVRAMVRDGDQGGGLRELGLEVVSGDFDHPDSLAAALSGVDRAFFLPANGPAQVEQGANFIAAAKSAGIRHVVKVSGFLPDRDSANPNARRHWRTNDALKSSGLAWTLLRPNFFMQNMLMFRDTIERHQRFHLNAGGAVCGMIHVRDIATVAAVCLTTPGHEGREHVLTGPAALSFSAVASALSQAAGHDIAYAPLGDGAFHDYLRSESVADDTADALTETYKGVGAGEFAAVTHAVEALTGRPATPFDVFAREFMAPAETKH